MKRSLIIDKLSKELSIQLQKEDEFELIKQFITRAIVTEIERSIGYDLQIYQKLDIKTGSILGEYWGMDEIYQDMKKITGANSRSIRSGISRNIKGERHSAFGFIWKKL